MQRAGLIDASFLAVESYRTPMHVGCLQIFSPPPKAGRGFMRKLVEELRTSSSFSPPYSLKIQDSPLKILLPAWVEDDAMDINHHLQQWALPYPGGQRELGALISKLHGLELDMERPPWECHFIEGLDKNRFALYTKIHHALVDGIGGIRLLQAMLSTDPCMCHMPAPWEPHPDVDTSAQHEPQHHYHQGVLRTVVKQLVSQTRIMPGLYGAFSGMAKSAFSRKDSDLVSPYVAPKTHFNARISSERRFATQQLSLTRIRKIAEAADATINDVFLALCGSALRQYLQERNELPDMPLVAGLPMSVRPKGNTELGTQVTFILASLATHITDPRKRLEAICASTNAAKINIQQLDSAAFTEYTMILMLPYIAQLLSGTSGYGRPIFNVVISNVPGPSQPLYFNGAKLEAVYPLSIVTHGQGLNITLLSYLDRINVGFTACNKSAPHVQHMAGFLAQALDDLEACYKRPAKRKSGANKR